MNQAITIRELIEQRDAINRQIESMRAEKRAEAFEQVKALITEFDFNAHELGLIKTQQLKRGPKGAATFPQKSQRPPAPPLYRDPKTGATWSGRGRQPRWLEGHDRDEFLIDAGSAGR
jgi:DNA-binding protein H-NS